MKSDIYAELYLWNKNIDSLVRAMQRIELLGVCSGHLLKTHETRLQEIRASLNADLLEAILTQERADEARFQQLVAVRRENTTEKNHLQ